MRGLAATLRAAVLDAAANRGALLSQMTAMIVNDAVWVVFWALFLNRTGDLGGWDLDGIMMLQAVLTTAGGIALGLTANARHLGAIATQGGLDSVLTLPTAPLSHVLVRRVEPVNLGDMVFGVTLFSLFGNPTPERAGLFVLAVTASATILIGFLVLTGSLAFFAGRSETGELGFHSIVMLGSYPVDIFSGVAKVFLHAVIPAAFVSSVPARVVLDFDAGQAATLVGVAAVVAVLAIAVFQTGLRRYTSGALWARG